MPVRISVKTAAVIFAVILIFSASVNAFASNTYSSSKRDGIAYTDAHGNRGTVPYGKKILVYEDDYENGEYKALWENKKIIIDKSEIGDSYHDLYGDKSDKPVKYRVFNENGALIRATPDEDGIIMGKINPGKEFEITYYSYDEFTQWVYVNYKGKQGWVHDTDLVKVRPENSTGKIVVVGANVALSKDRRAVSKVIPAGTVLEYDWSTDHYYEGGETMYYTEYDGVKGWICGLHCEMDMPNVCECTLDVQGYVMVTDKSDCGIYSGPFRTGEKLEARVPNNTVLESDSYAEKTVDKTTGKTLTSYDSYESFDYGELDKYTETVTTCRVDYKGVTGWITITNQKTGFATSTLPVKDPVTYTLTADEIKVYEDYEAEIDAGFSIPRYSLLTAYFTYYTQYDYPLPEYVEYNGRFGWIKPEIKQTENISSMMKTAITDIEVVADPDSKKVTGTLRAGTDFIETASQSFAEENGGYTFFMCGDKSGWIRSDSDIIVAVPYDLSEFIDFPAPEEPGRGESAVQPGVKETESVARGATASDAETTSPEKDGLISGLKTELIAVAVAALVIIVIAVLLIAGRAGSKKKK